MKNFIEMFSRNVFPENFEPLVVTCSFSALNVIWTKQNPIFLNNPELFLTRFTLFSENNFAFDSFLSLGILFRAAEGEAGAIVELDFHFLALLVFPDSAQYLVCRFPFDVQRWNDTARGVISFRRACVTRARHEREGAAGETERRWNRANRTVRGKRKWRVI